MKNIVLVEFTLAAGHHFAYIMMFAETLLKQGHQVFALVPEASRLEPAMAKSLPQLAGNFHAVDFKYEMYQKAKSGSALDTALANLKKWGYENQLIKGIEQKYGVSIDLVFYNWLDYQFSRYIPGFILDRIFPYKWSGLYMHPYHLRLEPQTLAKKASWRDYDSVFLAKNCLGVTIHDRAVIEGFSRRIGKPVIYFPDSIDDTPPDYEYPLYKEIMQRAAGRIVVGLIGSEIHKGTVTMARMAKMADPEKYFFAFLGKVQWFAYDETSKKELEDFVASNRENCIVQFEPIPEGGPYNAVFSSFDVPYLVYNDFISSSNRLVKAAVFQRLVLASDNHCVGDDVKTFNLGEAVKPMDANAALEGLHKLTQRIEHKDYPYKQWEEYARLHSLQMLDERFKEVISLLE